MLRLKMQVNAVKRVAGQSGEIEAEEISLHAVYGNSEENKEWSKWTPSGVLNFTVNNPGAMGKVLPGKSFYVDLTPAE